jgi:hypothetical protein
VNHYFDPLIALLDHTIKQGFMKPSYRDMIVMATNVDDLIESISRYSPKHEVKWS